VCASKYTLADNTISRFIVMLPVERDTFAIPVTQYFSHVAYVVVHMRACVRACVHACSCDSLGCNCAVVGERFLIFEKVLMQRDGFGFMFRQASLSSLHRPIIDM
jgi:hypothetical protein